VAILNDALNEVGTMRDAIQGGGQISDRSFQLTVLNTLILVIENALSGTPSSETVAGNVTSEASTLPVQMPGAGT
jgi:hypothetical protein